MNLQMQQRITRKGILIENSSEKKSFSKSQDEMIHLMNGLSGMNK